MSEMYGKSESLTVSKGVGFVFGGSLVPVALCLGCLSLIARRMTDLRLGENSRCLRSFTLQ